MPQRPLSHIRVLDFGHYLAGPLTGMMLADMGAEVIRITPPGGTGFDGPAFDMLSRGKQVLELDLKSDEGRATAIELAKRADAVIENFRPGVMERLGLGPEVLRAANSQLVYLSMPGFASTDAELADLPAWEAVIAAYTGQFTDMGLNRRLMGINPSFSPLTLASAYGASFGAMSVLFALNAREANGGDHIEVPLAAALLEGLVYNCEQIEDYPERYKSPREVELDRREAEGLPMNLAFEELSEFFDPFYRTYTCADGRGFYVVSGSVATHPRRVLETLGLKELADELPDFSAYLDTRDWPAEWSMRNYPVGPTDRARVSTAMKQAFLTKPSHEWEELFGAAKAPATAQRFTKEWLDDPHALASGLVLQVEDAKHGPMRQMGNVAWLADDETAAQKSSAVQADLAALLAEPQRGGDSGQEGKGWLDGLKVLDLTNVIAGPTIGSTLARYGAEVTLVQPVEPSVDPWNTVVFGIHAQRGKESILLNLRTEEGQEALARLIAEADAVTMNGTDQQRDHLGLHPERLAEINPRLILVQLDAFGGVMRGPKSDHLGYDDLAQAATGVMLRFGGGMATPEEHAHFGTIDVLTGFCACVALGAALLKRSRTGEGGIARADVATGRADQCGGDLAISTACAPVFRDGIGVLEQLLRTELQLHALDVGQVGIRIISLGLCVFGGVAFLVGFTCFVGEERAGFVGERGDDFKTGTNLVFVEDRLERVAAIPVAGHVAVEAGDGLLGGLAGAFLLFGAVGDDHRAATDTTARDAAGVVAGADGDRHRGADVVFVLRQFSAGVDRAAREIGRAHV